MQTQKTPPMLAAAVAMVIVGFLAGILLIIPAIRDSNEVVMTTLYVLAMLAPVGLLLGVVFALLSGRRSR